MARTAQRSGRIARTFGQAALALALMTVIGGAAMAPASAGNDDGHRREQARRDHDRDRHQRPRGYAAPVNVYAPPPVYYAPPAAPPAIDFVFPLRFR